MKKALLVGALVLAMGAEAGAATVISPESGTSYPYQQWADRAKVPTPDVTLTVVETTCPIADAPACTRRDSLTIWESPTGAAAGFPSERRAVVKRGFLHELGHNFDYYALSEERRANLNAVIDLSHPWVTRELQSASPHELFADAYATCALGGWRQPAALYESSAQTPLPRSQMADACYLIRH